jgi:hypothetical protein
MDGDEVADATDDESELSQRSRGRRRRAIGLIGIAAIVAVAGSVAYLNSPGTSLLGTLSARFGTASPADYRPPGGPGPLLAPTSATRGWLRRNPISVVIERFGGMNDQPPSSMIASVAISDPVVVNSLFIKLNDLPPFPRGVFHCPMDDRSYFALIFIYVDGTKVSVKVESSGCGEVFVAASNQPVAWTATSPSFVASLEGLLAPQASGY